MISKRTGDASLLLVVTCNRPYRNEAATLTVPTEALVGDIDGDYIGYFEEASSHQWLFVGPLFEAACRVYHGSDRWKMVANFSTQEQLDEFAQDQARGIAAWLHSCWDALQVRKNTVLSGRRAALEPQPDPKEGF